MDASARSTQPSVAEPTAAVALAAAALAEPAAALALAAPTVAEPAILMLHAIR